VLCGDLSYLLAYVIHRISMTEFEPKKKQESINKILLPVLGPRPWVPHKAHVQIGADEVFQFTGGRLPLV